MKTRFFDFGDLFNFNGRRRVPVTEAGGNPIPPEVQGFADLLRESQPPLEKIIRAARQIPGASIFSSVLLVDGKPCLLNFKDNVPPGALEREMEAMVKPINVNGNFIPENLPVAPSDDLVSGVEKMLREIYKVEDTDVLGAIWSPHHAAAMKLGEVLEKAKKRDRANIVKNIARLLESLN